MARKKAVARFSASKIRVAYLDEALTAEQLRSCLYEQISSLVATSDITLGTPIESRLKSLDSILEKSKRKRYNLQNLSDVSDLVGLRVCVLFQRDLERIREIISENFEILTEEDTFRRLDDGQFGYQSLHLQIRLKEQWLGIPTYASLGGKTAELQLRTLAQHIWAAASHKLQYKREASVPQPVRRSINRVSALLETVDLEFSRVLQERDAYNEFTKNEKSSDELNVETLRRFLDDNLPRGSRSGDEDYDDLVGNLSYYKITTVGDLAALFAEKKDIALQEDAKAVNAILSGKGDEFEFDLNQVMASRSFYSHVGLVREMLQSKYSTEEVMAAMYGPDCDQ